MELQTIRQGEWVAVLDIEVGAGLLALPNVDSAPADPDTSELITWAIMEGALEHLRGLGLGVEPCTWEDDESIALGMEPDLACGQSVLPLIVLDGPRGRDVDLIEIQAAYDARRAELEGVPA